MQVPGERGGISKASESSESDPEGGGTKQCPGRVTTGEGKGGGGSGTGTDADTDEEKQGFPNITRSRKGSSE